MTEHELLVMLGADTSKGLNKVQMLALILLAIGLGAKSMELIIKWKEEIK